MVATGKDPREEVIQAWYMDDSDGDQRLPHHKEPKEFVSLDQLAELGVLSWRLDADNHETDPELKKIREERGYSYMDVCEVCPEKLPNYEEKIKNFYEEHLHTDEEIRYCVAGSASCHFLSSPCVLHRRCFPTFSASSRGKRRSSELGLRAELRWHFPAISCHLVTELGGALFT